MPHQMKYGFGSWGFTLDFTGEIPPVGTVIQLHHPREPGDELTRMIVSGHSWKFNGVQFEVLVDLKPAE